MGVERKMGAQVEDQLLQTATAMAQVDKGFDVVIVCWGNIIF